MKNEKRLSPSRIASGVLYGALILHPLIWNRYFPRYGFTAHPLAAAMWFAIPVLVIWFAEHLAGRIRFLTIRGPQNEPAWAVRILGWILFFIQIVVWFMWVFDVPHLIYNMG